jgi:hypothetical protein
MEQLNLSPNNLLLTAKDIGSFILTRLRGGAYSELTDLGSQLNDEINQVEDNKDQTDTLKVI